MVVWASVASARPTHSHPWLAEVLFALDDHLLRRDCVIEYSQDPACLFRLEIDHLRRPLALRDGTRVAPAQRMARLHFWNRHVPPVPRNGASIAWARRMQKAIALSLRELTRYLQSRPDLDDVAVICGDVPNATQAQSDQLARIMAYYGFETIAEHAASPIGQCLHRFGENILISLIVLAQNAAALRLDTLSRVRVPIYLSRERLERRFGDAGRSAAQTGEAS